MLAETICAGCPFRRDTERRGELFDFISKHGFPGFEPHNCEKQKKSICLGWVIFIQNQACAMQIRDEELRQEIREWSDDPDTVFGGGSEMLRYHRGEWFGSEDWRSNWKSRFSSEPAEVGESPAQGEFDL